VAYALLAEGRNTEEAIEQLDAAIGMTEDPAEEARRELRKHQEASGMTFENPDAPVAPPDQDGVESWMTRDEEFGR